MQDQFNSIALLLNIPAVCTIAFIAWAGWSVFGAIFYEKMRKIGLVLFIAAALVILFITVFSRSKMIKATVYPIPFSTFFRAQKNRRLYYYLIMNLIMFLPVGFSLPFVFYGTPGRRIFWTIFIGFLFSVLIESIQVLFSIGYADIDDVIVNTLGAAVGSLTYPLSLLFMKMIRKAKE